MKTITMQSSEESILKQFRECPDTSSINLKMDNKHIYLVGGILNKLEGNNHFIVYKGRWVLV